jgi:hypothetical protein
VVAPREIWRLVPRVEHEPSLSVSAHDLGGAGRPSRYHTDIRCGRRGRQCRSGCHVNRALPSRPKP